MIRFIVEVWYYQTWLVVMSTCYYFVAPRRPTTATALYSFMVYVAVAWHPLIGQVLNAR